MEEGSLDSRQFESDDFDFDNEDDSEFDVSTETGDVTIKLGVAYSTP